MSTDIQPPMGRPSTGIHPLAWVVGIALILLCVTGIAAMMGWIPASIGGNRSAEAVPLPLPMESQSATATPSYPARSNYPDSDTTRHVATVQAPPVHVAAAACRSCGVVESVREINQQGNASGVGAVGGAVVGGVLGNQVGGGRGRDLATVAGAIGGALAGNTIEKRVQSTHDWQITVRMDDGERRVFHESNAPSWRNGDQVRITNGVIHANG